MLVEQNFHYFRQHLEAILQTSLFNISVPLQSGLPVAGLTCFHLQTDYRIRQFSSSLLPEPFPEDRKSFLHCHFGDSPIRLEVRDAFLDWLPWKQLSPEELEPEAFAALLGLAPEYTDPVEEVVVFPLHYLGIPHCLCSLGLSKKNILSNPELHLIREVLHSGLRQAVFQLLLYACRESPPFTPDSTRWFKEQVSSVLIPVDPELNAEGGGPFRDWLDAEELSVRLFNGAEEFDRIDFKGLPGVRMATIYALERFLRDLFHLWHKEAMGEARILSALEAYQSKLDDINAFHRFQQSWLKNWSSARPGRAAGQSAYEFYKGSSHWVIRFNDEPVRLKTKPEKGLQYIHRLLSYPDKAFSCHDLELSPTVSRETEEESLDVGDNILIQLPKQRPVSRETERQDALDSARRLEEDTDFDRLSMENQILLFAELYRLYQSLFNLEHTRRYATKAMEYRRRLDDALEDLKDENDTAKMTLLITRVGIIKKTLGVSAEEKKIDRVSRNIKNAIKSMEHPEARKFFEKAIKRESNMWIYRSDAGGTIEWNLTID